MSHSRFQVASLSVSPANPGGASQSKRATGQQGTDGPSRNPTSGPGGGLQPAMVMPPSATMV